MFRAAGRTEHALGLGLGMVLDCDLIVAEAETPFQLTGTARGPGAAKHWAQFYFRVAGAFGDEVALTGRFVTAEEALAVNLIDRPAATDNVLDVALSLASEVAAHPPLSVQATVRTRRRLLGRYAKAAAFHQAPMRLYLTEDFQEAALAFKQKRKPQCSATVGPDC
jgi:enoyl-CoA hydratase/carnithine racemase